MESNNRENESLHSALFLEGWLEYNRLKWHIQPLRVHLDLGGSDSAAIDTVLFLNPKGRIRFLKLNPYLAISFHPSPTKSPMLIARQWIGTASLLATEMQQRRLANTVALPPEVVDVRPWQWQGFRATVRYTYQVNFPFDINITEHHVRSRSHLCKLNGYHCDRTTDLKGVLACLQDTEARAGFRYLLKLDDLKLAQELMGIEHFRVYACFAPNGEMAAARIILHTARTRAIDWVAGTLSTYLKSGVTQYLTHYCFEDLQLAEASGIDFCGANIQGVASAKANWGGSLVPFYILEEYNVRQLARWIRDWWRARRR